MKTDRMLQCPRLVSLLVAFVVTHPSLAADKTKDEEDIKALAVAFENAMNANDAVALSEVFCEDADFTNVIGMTVHGRKAIEEFHRPLLEGDGTNGIPSFKNAHFKTAETRVRFVGPDVASVDVTWTQSGSTLNGKDRGPRRGLMNWTATKNGGEWRVAVMHNMDLLPVERGTAVPDATAIDQAEVEVRELDQIQAKAWLDRDKAALQRYWSPEFVLQAPSNQILTREGVFREMQTPRLAGGLASMERTVERVTKFGDIVISMGVDHYVPKNRPNAGLVREQRYTNVWRRDGNSWRMIARHAHALPIASDQPSTSSNPKP